MVSHLSMLHVLITYIVFLFLFYEVVVGGKEDICSCHYVPWTLDGYIFTIKRALRSVLLCFIIWLYVSFVCLCML